MHNKEFKKGRPPLVFKWKAVVKIDKMKTYKKSSLKDTFVLKQLEPSRGRFKRVRAKNTFFENEL